MKSTKPRATMTNHVGRLYAAAAGVLTFFVLWAVIAAHPWTAPPADAKLAALAERQRLLRREAVLVQKIVERRAAAKAAAGRARVAAAAPAPAVRIVTLPPLVVTRTS
jgi:hypothetical protein